MSAQRLSIAAVAVRHDARMHRDADFEIIAAVTSLVGTSFR